MMSHSKPSEALPLDLQCLFTLLMTGLTNVPRIRIKIGEGEGRDVMSAILGADDKGSYVLLLDESASEVYLATQAAVEKYPERP